MDALTRLRRLGCAAIAIGAVLTALTPELPRREPWRAGGYLVLAGDFHVHSFPDGLPPWDAVREARRRRLDVIAITSHNSRFGWWMLTHTPRWLVREDVLVLPGQELTSVGYHAAVVGLTSTVAWRQSLAEAAAAAHAQGAVAILAHPAGAALRRVITDEGLRSIDGVEVAHPAMENDDEARSDFLEWYERASSLDARTAAIGSSDFHVMRSIGLCRTYLFAREASAEGVLDAIREGRTAACDARGNVYGPAALTREVAGRCREDMTRPPDGDSGAARAGTFVVWAGLFALVLAGARQR